MKMRTTSIVLRGHVCHVRDILLCCLFFWPLFWNVWGVSRFSTSSLTYNIPMAVLYILTFLFACQFKRFSFSFLFFWFIFAGVSLLSGIRHPSLIVADFSVLLCGIVICVVAMDRKVDHQRLLRLALAMGLIVGSSVILDAFFGLFKHNLLFIYSEKARMVKESSKASGGLLPHSGSAGGYIYTGIAAGVTLFKIDRKGKGGILSFAFSMLIFGASAVLIQKRGFIVDTVAAIAVLHILKIKWKNNTAFRPNKIIRRVLFLLIILILLLLLYSKVPMIHDSIHSLVDRFTSETGSFSGRDLLYERAFSLVKGHYLTGIGWGQFRLSSAGIFGGAADKTYEAHNVYIQLLCETGIIGLGTFLLAAGMSFRYAALKYKQYVGKKSYEKTLMGFGIFLQLFFLAYCMSGNPLYDYNFLLTYFFGILFTIFPQEEIGEYNYETYRNIDVL